MPCFEYKLLTVSKSFFSGIDYADLTHQLNQLGQEGWEVLTTTGLNSAGTTTGLLVTLRRPAGPTAATAAPTPPE